MKEIDKAKKNYKQRTGTKRLLVKPIILQGTTLKSQSMYYINGKKMILVRGKSPDFMER